MAPGSALSELAVAVAGQLHGVTTSDPEIVDVTHDSRQAGPGVLFVAIQGEHNDGHRFVPDAVAGGAAAVCVEREMGTSVPELVVDDTRAVLGPLASMAHGKPSETLKVIGVTGTDGKTTVTHYVESISSGAGLSTGLVGTIRTRYAGKSVESERTTPEASDFQRLLAEMRDAGVTVAAVEVSSHALALRRVAGTRFDVAVFTNLSQDHLDFHGDMASYLAVKRSLFEEYQVGTAVVNSDDPAGVEIARSRRGDLVTVGGDGDVRVEERSPLESGTAFTLVTPWGSGRVTTPVMGAFNVDNAAIAAASCLSAGIDFDSVLAGLEDLSPVPGRFEIVSQGGPVTVIVDYAHTPRGISEAIDAARAMTRGRVIALGGAGGDRDREKRPMMGRALSEADLAVVTSDNPRSEEPEAIIAEVSSGLAPGTDAMVIVDRGRAIVAAVTAAREGDLILVLGRGHEPMQETGGDRRPFDDRQVVKKALAGTRRSANSDAKSGSMGQ
ncbi:MAG: UDP-N-acetylmuramoyl-L-alanyl-D-glutamate--2,6-diaminopimelate ligase [Acidimicrobiia bacterium]